MWGMASVTRVGVLFVGLAVIAACGDDAENVTGSARGTDADAAADDASTRRPSGAVVRVRDGGGQGTGADASTLDGGLDGGLDGSVLDGGLDGSVLDGGLDGGLDGSVLDGGLDASLDGSVGDAMPSPMPIEDASFDARAGTGGIGGFGGRGGAGGF
jgi:hypothetical protein